MADDLNIQPHEHIKLLEDEIEMKRQVITKLREALQEVYALTGEDCRIKEICSRLIDETRNS